ncbi:MAG: trigger factor [Chlamydiales bacterium]
METTNQKFQNDKVEVEVKVNPGCQIDLEIQALPKLAAKSYQEAIKEVRKRVSLPGFRKGKVPKEILDQQYASDINKEFYDILLNEALSEAFQVSSFYPFNTKSKVKIDHVKDLSSDKGGSFTAHYECFPKVPEIVPSDLQIQKIDLKEIKDDVVERHLNLLRLQEADLQEVTDRPAQHGDVVDLEISTMENDERKKEVKDIHLVKGMIEDEIIENVVGLEIGQSAENMQPPKREGEEQPEPIRVTLKSIRSGELPEINEEFLSKYKEESEESLRNRIRDVYTQEDEKDRQQAYHAAIEQALLDTYHFDVPLSMLQLEAERRESMILSEHEETLEEEQLKLVKEQAKKQAEETLRLQFLLSSFVREARIEVSNDEINQRLFQIMLSNRELMASNQIDIPQLTDRVRNALTFEKALNHLLDRVSFVS